MSRFYLTTPLYYVNARPHIGHAYTTIVADTLARWHRQRGEEVFLLTGTDEHGGKIAQAAAKAGLPPKAFADQTSETFKALWKKLGISYDHFIRTTDTAHERVVQQVLERLKPQLELGTYTFWYCVPCETSFGLNEVDSSKAVCPQCQRPITQVEEEDYFLPLEKHRSWLKEQIERNPDFVIRPASRRNEVLAMLEKELPDLCITRPKERVSWGIQVPFSPGHVTYVWFDALLNYVSALGWPDGEKFRLYWEETGAVHLVGKDIIRHHCLYWPIILHAAGIRPPRMVFAHGWWLVKGEKMSKSKGNIVEPEAVVSAYGLDPFRYFLLRDVPFGEDGVFSEEALVKRINADLANDLGNLVYRTLTMLEKHLGGRIPARSSAAGLTLAKDFYDTWQKMTNFLSAMLPSEALKALWELINKANQSVEIKAPWRLAKEGRREELEAFLYDLAEALRVVSLFLWPFLPTTAEAIWRQMGFQGLLSSERLPAALETPIPAGQMVRKEPPLFPRLE
ncbi:MAG: methionine--tRNA ligase [Candidatus Omnitrophica bacterium]|nr:methionine--tRNA ligase [Candidatus Omnitrophota bacterium]